MTDEPAPAPADDSTGTRPRRRWILGWSIAGGVALVAVAAIAAVVVAPALSPGAPPLVAPVALDVACEELIPDALVANAMAPDVSLLQDSGDAAWDFQAAYVRQAGGISCRWSNEVVSSHSLEGREEITLRVLPHAPYDYRFFHQKMLDYDNTRFDLAGDSSDQQCVVLGGHDVGCNGDLLVGHFWAYVQLSHKGDLQLDDEEEAHAVFTGLLSAVAEGLDGVSAPERWVTPEWIATPAAICADEVSPRQPRNPEFPPDVVAVAGERQGISGCPGFEGAPDFTIYPGSAWAWEEILSGSPGSVRPIEVAGADAAVAVNAFGREATYLSISGSILAFWDSPEAYAREVAASFAAAP